MLAFAKKYRVAWKPSMGTLRTTPLYLCGIMSCLTEFHVQLYLYIYNYFDDVDGPCTNFSTPHPAIPDCFMPSLQDSSLIRTLHDASGQILSVSWCGQWLAAGGADKKVRVYNAAQDGARQQVAQGRAQRHPK